MKAIKTLLAFALVSPFSAWAEPLPVVEVRPHAVTLSFPADGTVEAVQQAVVAAQVQGRILEVRADAGQVVKKGDVLMRIDAREAAEAVAAAEALYLNAKAHYERTRNLTQQKFMSQAALDKAKAELDAATANRGAAAAGSSHATIVAPMAGIVARRHAELGDMATPGKPLFTVYAPSGLRVTATVPQYRLKSVQGIKSVKVELPESALWVEGGALQVFPSADPNTHATQVRAALPAGIATAPGAFARLHFAVGEAQKMTVPATAVVRRSELTAVYVEAANQRPSLRQVRLGEAVGQGELEVLSGLNAGEKVFVDGVKAALAAKAAPAGK